jgi:hypothetical protein
MADDFTSTVSLNGSKQVGDAENGVRFVRGALWATPLGALLWALLVFFLSMIGE